MWNRISKTKEKEGQKLVISEQPTCDEIGQPIESRENDQASHKSNAAVEQMQNSSPQSPTAKPQWTSKRGAGLRHHKMVINALKYARQTYTNLGFADKNTEYYRNQKRRLLIMIDEQIKDFPDFAPGWLVRAEVNLIDDPISSIKDLDHLLRLYPGLPYALEMRARAQIELKQFEEALKDYDSALDTVRGSESLLLDKTKLLERLHRIDAAIATIDEALRTNAASVKLHLHKADLLASIGRQQEALNELRFAVLILDVRRQVGKIVYSENDTTYIDIARKMFDLAKPNEALATLDKSRFKKDPRAIELRTRIEQTQESTSKESGRSN